MYKKQLTAQKIICLIAIFLSAALFIYSLGIMTDLYDSLYSTMRNTNDLTDTDVPGSIVYYDMQNFNASLLKASIVLILLAVLLFITGTNKRRRYYIGNYIATGIYSLAAIIIAVWSHIEISAYKAQFLQIDFEALLAHSEMWGTAYIDSTFWFDVHYYIGALLIIEGIILIANAIWKVYLMKSERELLNNGKECKA